MKSKVALITGITGQDGAYLAEFLLSKNYIVHGIKRRSSSFNTERIDHLFQERSDDSTFILHYGDMSDGMNITRLIRDINPDEIYNSLNESIKETDVILILTEWDEFKNFESEAKIIDTRNIYNGNKYFKI